MYPIIAELFAALYANGYDVIIWSATGHKWIEAKLRETGVSSHPAYKITACMVRPAATHWFHYSAALCDSTLAPSDLTLLPPRSIRRTTPRW